MVGKHDGRQLRLLVDFINRQEVETISARVSFSFSFEFSMSCRSMRWCIVKVVLPISVKPVDIALVDRDNDVFTW